LRCGADQRALIYSVHDVSDWVFTIDRKHGDRVLRSRRAKGPAGRFAADTFTARNIAFELKLPADDHDIKLEGNLRREVFLIFKESIHNMVKHSGCDRAEIEFVAGEQAL
jgi:hypothetical protein